MKKTTICYVTYSRQDEDFVKMELRPILRDLNVEINLAHEYLSTSETIYERIFDNIKEASFIISIQIRPSNWVNFELGLAFAQSKPIIIITHRNGSRFSGIPDFHRIIFDNENRKKFQFQLINSVRAIIGNLIDKRIFNLAHNEKIIGIKIGSDYMDYEQELRFTAEFIKIIKIISNTDSIRLLDLKKGSLNSFISIDLKAFAELIEKLVFIIPEWKKRTAETNKIKAETAKIESEISISESKRKIEEAKAIADLLEKYKNLGLTIQFDSNIILRLDKNGELQINNPIELNE